MLLASLFVSTCISISESINFCIVRAVDSTSSPKHSPLPPSQHHFAIYSHMSSVSNEDGAGEEGGGVLPHKRMMPKRKRKFGKGATRGPLNWSDTTPVERHAELAVPGYAAAASDRVSSDSAAVPPPLSSLVLSTSTSGRLMIASQTTRRFCSRGWMR